MNNEYHNQKEFAVNNLNIIFELTHLEQFSKYMDALIAYKEKIIIILSVKDNCYILSDPRAKKILSNLGCKQYPSSNFKAPYITVINGGNVFVEKTDKETSNTIIYQDGEFDIKSSVKLKDDIYIKYRSTECAVNQLGLNIAVIDKETDTVIDTLSFSSIDDICMRLDPKAIGIDPSERYDFIMERMINEAGLVAGKKMAIRYYENLGDFYSLCRSISSAEKILNQKFVLVSCSDNQEEIASWFSEENSIETYRIPIYEYRILSYADPIEKKKYKDYLIEWDSNHPVCKLTTNINNTYVKDLAFPKEKKINEEYYIKKYGIIPQKTILMMPLSVCVQSPPDYFWNFSAKLFESLGFKVVFNVNEKQKKRFNADSVFVPISDIIGFANLCGYVLSVRSGIMDVLSTSTANMTIFSTSFYRPIDVIYGIENADDRIRTIYYDYGDYAFEKTFPFNILYEQFNNYYSGIKRSYADLCNISCSDAEIENLETPNVNTFAFYPITNRFRKDEQRKKLFDLKYVFQIKSNTLCLSLQDIEEVKYNIDYTLLFNGKPKAIIPCHNSLNVIFVPKRSGNYSVKVVINDKSTFSQAVFTTNELTYSVGIPSNLAELPQCYDILAYVFGLQRLSKDTVIFISSRDSHSTINGKNYAELSAFGILNIKSDLVNSFRYSYMCVIDSGKVMIDKLENNNPIKYKYDWDGHTADIISQGYNVAKNDTSPISIQIDGIEVAVNKRGLNIVVWDKKKNRIADSVCFDTFTDSSAYR